MNDKTRGWLNGFLAVLVFSGSTPGTRAAVAGLDPFFLTSARAAIAGLLAGALLLSVRSPPPKRERWSERQDLNLRPLDPQSSALPGCATLRCRESGLIERPSLRRNG